MEKTKIRRLLGQFFRLHGTVIVFFPLHLPPWVAWTFIDLFLVKVPSPHELLHSSVVIQDPHSQLIVTAKFEILSDQYISTIV